jgi:hypothetical protein
MNESSASNSAISASLSLSGICAFRNIVSSGFNGH